VPARFDLVTIDVGDPTGSAEFWSRALDLVETEREDGDRWVVLSTRDGIRRIGLQRGDHRPSGTHLDLVCDVDEFASEIDRLIAVGARLLASPRVEEYGSIANFTDPEGNAFDLCAYVS
jgi:predicted enzyme related to lactoylglutathione lyase